MRVYECFGKILLSTHAFDQVPSTEAAGPQQRPDLIRRARHHQIFMKILLEDLYYMVELKACAYPAPGPTRTHYPSHRSTLVE